MNITAALFHQSRISASKLGMQALSSNRLSSLRRTWASVLLLPLVALAAILGSVKGAIAEETMPQSPEPLYLAQAAPSGSGTALRLNDSGDAVSNLQEQLAALGYFNDEVTGFFGSATQAAVVKFQQDQGLTADGVVGAATVAALGGQTSSVASADSGAAPSSLVKLNDTGTQVTELQRRLSELGYYSGTISGVFDRTTEAAVMQFQQANGLPSDGVVGAATTAALRTTSQSGASGVTPAASGGLSNGLLKLGSTGSAVVALQTRLQQLGFYTGTVTGSFGPDTEAAVIAFQRSNGLIADGIVGAQVNAALANRAGQGAIGTAPSIQQPNGQLNGQMMQPQTQYIQQAELARQQAELARQQAEQARLEAEQARLVYQQNMQEGRYSVFSLQQQLNSEGFSPGEANGMLTPQTQSAISEAQRSYGLTETDLGIPQF